MITRIARWLYRNPDAVIAAVWLPGSSALTLYSIPAGVAVSVIGMVGFTVVGNRVGEVARLRNEVTCYRELLRETQASISECGDGRWLP